MKTKLLPADKGNITVIMKQDQYKSKLKSMLEEGPYRVIRNPTKKTTVNVIKAVKSSTTLGEATKAFIVISDPRPPLFYGLPIRFTNQIFP